MIDVTCVCAAGATLGEGTLWDPDRQVVWWVDIGEATLHAHHAATGRNHRQSLECRITALGLCDSGDLVACGDAGFVRLAVAADLTVRTAEVIARVQEPPGHRFNDGKVDGNGAFWAGTMDDAERDANGSLYRLRGRRVTRMRHGIAVPNGPCFLADGTVLATDTAAGIISAFTVDDGGSPVAEREFARFAPAQGYPDGMTVDEQQHVWVAFWDGGCLRRLNPHGRVVQEVPLPVRRPTCPTFGGPDLDVLYVSSATKGLDDATLARQPWSGGLLQVRVGLRGQAPARFSTRRADDHDRTFAPHSA